MLPTRWATDDFDRCTPTGIAHDTVTVLYDGTPTEVTVFPKEPDHSHLFAPAFARGG